MPHLTDKAVPPAKPACAAADLLDNSSSEATSSEDDRESRRSSRNVRTRRKLKRSSRKFASSSDESSSEEERAPRRTQRRVGRKVRSESEDEDEDAIEVQSLSGPKKILKGKASAASTSQTWSKREVMYRLAASIDDLASGKVPSVVGVTADGTLFDSDNVRTSNHILGGAFITSVKSDFPVTLHIGPKNQQASASNNSYTHNGMSGALTVAPGESFQSEKGVELVKGNPMGINAPFLAQYKGWTKDNIHEKITYIDDETAAVHESHPIVLYFNAVREKNGEPPLGPKQRMSKTSPHYTANATDTKACVEKLRELLQDKLQIQDLYETSGISVARAFGTPQEDQNGSIAWDDEEELFDAIDGENLRKAARAQKHALYVKVQYLYRPTQ